MRRFRCAAVDAVEKAARTKSPGASANTSPKAEIETAFKASLPEPRGIAPNQPAPGSDSGRYWKLFGLLSLIALLLQIGFVAGAKISAPSSIR